MESKDIENINFYRYEAIQYASVDHDGDYVMPRIPNPKLVLKTFSVLKETSKGYWIGYGSLTSGKLSSQGRWVSKTTKKRFAYPTKKEALDNLIKRTEKRVSILEYQVDTCKSAILIAKSMLASITNADKV